MIARTADNDIAVVAISLGLVAIAIVLSFIIIPLVAS